MDNRIIKIRAKGSSIPLKVIVRWNGKEKTIDFSE